MEMYKRVEKPRPETKINENEIRITTRGLIRNYLDYATHLLQERQLEHIVLTAMGNAISNVVVVTEIMKKRCPTLHQETSISSISITDVWEPIEEGLLPVETSRSVSVISISLSSYALDDNSPGYQAPLHVEHPKMQNHSQQQHYQPKQSSGSSTDGNEVADSYEGGRGRDGSGRGHGYGRENGGYSNWGQRGGRGRDYGNRENGGYSNWGQGGRGRYNGNHGMHYQENGGYSNRGQRGGRGRDNSNRENGGYSNYGQGGRGRDNGNHENGGYSNYGQGGGRGRDNGNRENGGYSNWGGQGGGRGRGYGNHGGEYERGGGGYGRGRGRMGGRRWDQ
ncbi:hypothetical protein MKW94_003902 [Papaver nudicaule]|uniref:DNA/RNA-binding protein Alba-like domain-containing protein n=1 Tax=Papaver nudicaule TaxID=74823 RepID=A0AA41S9P3_PAPNU|nr:hypothetical protein [Papaver nudicaule]